MVSTGGTPRHLLVEAGYLTMDRETATGLSFVAEELDQRLQDGAARAIDETVSHSITEGVRKHGEPAECVGGPPPILHLCLPGKQEIFDIGPYPLDKGDSDKGAGRTGPKLAWCGEMDRWRTGRTEHSRQRQSFTL